MTKNIVILCDGTGNEIEENLSNVMKFYRALERSDRQLVYYDPGIGTNTNSSSWGRVRNQIRGVFRLMTGHGLDQNVLDAYRFLARHYRPGDQVYMLGFSRGAYTVRVLAGMVYLCGLLSPEQENLAEYAILAYKKSGYKHVDDDDERADKAGKDKTKRRGNLHHGWRIRDTLNTAYVPIRFVGCWDTVASIITPREDRILIPALQVLPYTRTNPSVQSFRHAIAIDEKRRMFRLNDWKEGQKVRDRWNKASDADPAQDCKQVWFAGDHSDIGGGYPEAESGPAKITLDWMITEAKGCDLHFDEDKVERMVKGSGDNPVGPSTTADLHDSMLGMKGLWKPMEWLPKNKKWKQWPDRKVVLNRYLPRSEPRPIPADNDIHDSVWERAQFSAKIGPYEPLNLKDREPSQIGQAH